MKKQFGRTKAGKALLFIGCTLLTALLVLDIAGIVQCIQEEAYSLSRTVYLCRSALPEFVDRAESLIQENWEDLDPDSDSFPGQTLVGNLPSDDLAYRIRVENSGTDREAVRSEAFSDTETASLIFWVTKGGGLVLYKGMPGKDLSATPDTHVRVQVDFSLLSGNALSDSNLRILNAVYTLRYAFFALAVLLLAGSIACYVGLLKVSARRPGTDELVPGPLNQVPFDVLLALCIVLPCVGYKHINRYTGHSNWGYFLFIALTVIAFLLFLGLSMSAAARVKQKNLLTNTLIGRLCRLLIRGVRAIPVVWKASLALGLFVLLEIHLIDRGYYYRHYNFASFASWALPVLLALFLLYTVFQFKKLKKAAARLADGELNYKVNTRGMLFDEKQLGESLNRLGDGMNKAVEERLKADRMKTELITNVSHDIKTPLTSIVSYTELLKAEENLSEQGKEAVDVLSRQSERLTRLISDLVEASKASSGILDVALAPCDAAVFVAQAAGEYEERLKDAGLTLLTKVPEEPLRIMADGRRMQRIFDNLMNNIAKYSLPGTRVYLDLEKKGQRAVFQFKNTSREPLNVSADELLERFVRGDSSRHTEGNGLGLSIAQSLTELQGGTLQIQVDGDLFKVVMSFPEVE
jgi:signal transduction histidine kinase